MASRVAGKKYDRAASQFAGEQRIGWLPEWGNYFHPFLIFETFNMIKPAAADNSDAIVRHAPQT